MTPEESAKMAQMESDLALKEGALAEKEDSLYSEAIKGTFTSKGLNALVKSVNRALPLFEVEPYAEFGIGTVNTLPPEFVRILAMVSKAVEDGVEAGALSEDALIDLSTVKDDQALLSLAGRINIAATSPAFKRMLKGGKQAEKPEPIEPSESPESMSESDTTALFSSRM